MAGAESIRIRTRGVTRITHFERENGMNSTPFVWPAAGAQPPAAVVTESGRTFWNVAYSMPIGYRPVELDLHVPRTGTPPPVALWVHGGAFQEGSRRSFPPSLEGLDLIGALLDRGIAVASVDYRLSHEAPFPAALHDLKAALRYLRRFAVELGIDADRVGLIGESAGGCLVAMLGLTGCSGDAAIEGIEGFRDGRTDVSAVVDWYGLHDLTTMPQESLLPFLESLGVDVRALTDEQRIAPMEAYLGADPRTAPEMLRRASPIEYVSPSAPPFLLIHGLDDHAVPYEQSEMLHEKLRAKGVSSTLVGVPAADHTFIGHSDIAGIVGQSADFLARELAAPA
ncbi:Acetyl esterase [Microbacterium hydrocarbonoxydans]|uniref:Acetyl esterase n=1 Tax=Microbacterium hydrocarbonoxydans TaxID=273678 RepID=A0A0M2HKS3_9MICO|nr:alpha/beta hydrolase [Microbacterium hydrocarbonoxydans]KJL47286.1 Acetyl esterase [Microbacterium hydrocarbonoxydans]